MKRIFVPAGLAALAMAGLWLLVAAGVKRQALHPNPQAIASVTHSAAAPERSEAVDRARRIIRAQLAEQNLPGLSVAVGVGGEVVWAEGFGWANIESRVPVTPNTRFRIGTASTVLTSAAAGLLFERGRLRLDGEIQAYVPQFPKKPWPVMLGQLMAHTGGVGSDGGEEGDGEGPLLRQRCERPVEALRHWADAALLFEPGTRYRYSKYGWILVSAAVEGAAEQPFATFLREQVFQPLRMDHTGAESAAEENPEHAGEPGEDAPFITLFRQLVLEPLWAGGRRKTAAASADPAKIYVPGFGPDPLLRYGLHALRPHNLSCYAGSMAFLSTPADLVRFGLAMHAGTLVRPATARLLQTPQKLASGQETGHGLGWDLQTVTLAGKPAAAAGSDGAMLGRNVVSLLTLREAGIVVAAMSNMAGADTPALALKVAEEFAIVHQR